MSGLSTADLHIKTDIMSTLKAFARHENQQVNWNGFSIYCMQVAASFMHYYKKTTGKTPKGLDTKYLAQLSDLTQFSLAQINGFTDDAHPVIQEEVKEFVEFLDGQDASRRLREELTKANERIGALSQELKHEKNKVVAQVGKLTEKIAALQAVVESSKSEQSQLLLHENYVKATLNQINASTAQTVVKIHQTLTATEALTTAADEETKELFSSLVDRINTQVAVINLESGKTVAEMLKDADEKMASAQAAILEKDAALQRANSTIDALKQQLEENQSPTGVALSDEIKSLIQKLHEHVVVVEGADDDLNVDDDLYKTDFMDLFASIDNDFTGEDDFAQHLKNVLSFARTCLYLVYIMKRQSLVPYDDLIIPRNEFEKQNEVLTPHNISDLLLVVHGFAKKDLDGMEELYQKRDEKYQLRNRRRMMLLTQEGETPDINVARIAIASDPSNQNEDEYPQIVNMQTRHMYDIVFYNIRDKMCHALVMHIFSMLIYYAGGKIQKHLPYMQQAIETIFPENFNAFTHAIKAAVPLDQVQKIYKTFLELPPDKFTQYPMTMFHQGLAQNTYVPALSEDHYRVYVKSDSNDPKSVTKEFDELFHVLQTLVENPEIVDQIIQDF